MSMSTSRFLYQLIAVTVGAGMIFVAAHLLDDFELKKALFFKFYERPEQQHMHNIE